MDKCGQMCITVHSKGKWGSAATLAVAQVITGNIFHAEPEKRFFEPRTSPTRRMLHHLLSAAFVPQSLNLGKAFNILCEEISEQTGYHGFHGP